MRIECPACNAAYQVPDEQLLEGRVVRCARCGTDWTPRVAIPEDDSNSPSEPEPVEEVPEPPAKPVARPEKMAIEDDVPDMVPPMPPPAREKVRRPVPLLPIAWVLSVAIVIGGLTVLVMKRDHVMAAWPPSVRGYAAVGLAPRR